MTLINSKIHFVLLAGGNSLRFSSNTNKLLAKFKNKNLLKHNIEFIKELKFKKITLIINNLKNTNLNIFDDLEVNVSNMQTYSKKINDLTLGTASDRVWGKKFKIRLKSKDTGKIIDLNLKLNLVKDNTN